jgi:prepilin-type N-terminal cleavage/methylation domain-containing protein
MSLMQSRISALRRLRDERGFTLVELLVVMVAGVVVSSALFTILDVTLHQTTRTFSRVDASQRARIAMETIEQELHSGCYANDVYPVIDGTATSISFWSQYGSAANLTPTKHTISLDTTTGNLTDATYTTSGTSPNWVASATPQKTVTLLTNVSQSPGVPVFSFYELRSTGSYNLGSSVSGSTARAVSEVRITMVVNPAGGSGIRSDLTPNTVTNTVTLRLTPIPNPSPTLEKFTPCQ